MLHTINDTERRYGFLQDEAFSKYASNHVFRGVFCRQLDGTIKQRLRHRRGDYHRHSKIARVDGFTELISEMGDVVDVVVSNDNIIYITEM